MEQIGESYNLETESMRRSHIASFLLVLFLCIGVGWFSFTMKDHFHIDEVWSYSLSNNYGHPFLFTHTPGVNGDKSTPAEGEWDIHDEPSYQDFVLHWIDGKTYNDYITVQQEHRFDFKNVYRNQEMDTHPFMYYCLLHTVCSLFPNEFSSWFGWVVNIIFYVGTLILLYRTARLLFDSHFSGILAMLLWGLSRAGISDLSFLRMYMMLTFFSVLLVYATIRLMRCFSIGRLVVLFVIHVVGFLTQYYFYVFAFFLTAGIFLFYLVRKEWLHIVQYCMTVLLSVCVALVIFPATLRHAFSGTWYNGLTENVQNRGVLYSIGSFFSCVIQDFFGLNNALPYIMVFLFFSLLLLYCVLKYKKSNKTAREFFNGIKTRIRDLYRSNEANYILYLLPVVIVVSGSIVAWLSPSMQYYSGRYFFYLMPFIPLLVAVYVTRRIYRSGNDANETSNKPKLRYAPAAISIVFFLIVGNVFFFNPYIRLEEESPIDLEQQVTDRDVIFFNTVPYKVSAFSPFFRHARKVLMADELDDRFGDRLKDNPKTVVLVDILKHGLPIIPRLEKAFSDEGLLYKRLPDAHCGNWVDYTIGVYEVERK